MDFRLKLKLDFPMHANTHFVDNSTEKCLEVYLLLHDFFFITNVIFKKYHHSQFNLSHFKVLDRFFLTDDYCYKIR